MFVVTKLGDSAVNVEFANVISVTVNHQVQALSWLLDREQITGFIEWIVTYRSLTLFYDPLVLSFEEVRTTLYHLSLDQVLDQNKGRRISIPVCYDEAYGPDLRDLSAATGLSIETVIALHTEPDYPVYMLGFLPGFAYLGGLNPRLAMARLATPRLSIPAGSVGIAGEQTGIYPLSSPGGWRLIGQTPLTLFDPDRDPMILFSPGDSLHFEAIDDSTFKALKAGKQTWE